VDVQLPAVLAVPEDGEHTKQLRARIVNLSAGGARVVFAHDEATFALRSSIFLRFVVDDELPLLVLGRIVEAKRQNDIETVLRLEFMSMDDERRSRLDAYVQSLLHQELVERLVSE
jgi:c-di-GMP-binding flagellar brake protein YcgR